jgi:hypothetical protein
MENENITLAKKIIQLTSFNYYLSTLVDNFSEYDNYIAKYKIYHIGSYGICRYETLNKTFFYNDRYLDKKRFNIRRLEGDKKEFFITLMQERFNIDIKDIKYDSMINSSIFSF